jgi:hypothetical protein
MCGVSTILARRVLFRIKILCGIQPEQKNGNLTSWRFRLGVPFKTVQEESSGFPLQMG